MWFASLQTTAKLHLLATQACVLNGKCMSRHLHCCSHAVISRVLACWRSMVLFACIRHRSSARRYPGLSWHEGRSLQHMAAYVSPRNLWHAQGVPAEVRHLPITHAAAAQSTGKACSYAGAAQSRCCARLDSVTLGRVPLRLQHGSPPGDCTNVCMVQCHLSDGSHEAR